MTHLTPEQIAELRRLKEEYAAAYGSTNTEFESTLLWNAEELIEENAKLREALKSMLVPEVIAGHGQKRWSESCEACAIVVKARSLLAEIEAESQAKTGEE